jgi:serine/threonine protein kinase
MCRATGLVPASCTIAQDIVNLSEEPIARTAFSDVWTGALSGRQVAVKALRVHGIQVQAAKKVRCVRVSASCSTFILEQAYLHELVVWKCLRHPNIVPFIGVSLLFEVSLVSEWMSGGTLSSFISQYPDHDRSALVCRYTCFRKRWMIINIRRSTIS